MGAMLYLSAFTVIAKWFLRRLSLALSLMSVGAGLGGLICAPASALLISHFGWRMAFVVTGLVTWAVALPLALVVRNSPAEKGLLMDGDEPAPDQTPAGGPDGSSEDPLAHRDFTLGQALLSRPFWLLVGGFFFQGMAQSVVVVHAIPALTDSLTIPHPLPTT
jgi:sugar phosphate permease